MSKKAKRLIDRLASMELLELAADDALRTLKDKDVWYARRFRANRTDCLERIQNMIILGDYPRKEYVTVQKKSATKTREITPLPFYPWSVLFHAVKRLLDPIAGRVLIYDCSAGTKGKGQVFAALRTRMFVRRYRECTHIVQADIRKYYQSITHEGVKDTLRQFVEDELFITMIEKTVLDFYSNIEDLLREQWELKRRYCKWAYNAPFEEIEERGTTIGGCINQLLGNLTLGRIDRMMKEEYGVRFYHRHCDDIIMGARSQEEGERLLAVLDKELTRMGLHLKASSCVFPLRDDIKGVKGRSLDYVGYTYYRARKNNMRMRQRTKKNFARKLKGVRSKRRRREVMAAYWGIAKWGKCGNLWNTILRQNGIMSFAEVGIKTEKIRTGRDGKRMFDVPQEKIGTLADSGASIVVQDFEADITIKEGGGRCVVLFHHAGDPEDNQRKFVTTSAHIIDKLKRAREMEKDGKNIFPQQTRLIYQRAGNGRFTYDME